MVISQHWIENQLNITIDVDRDNWAKAYFSLLSSIIYPHILVVVI